MAWAWKGSAGCGLDGLGMAWMHSSFVFARRGLVWKGWVGLGVAGPGEVRRGRAGHGLAGHGMVWLHSSSVPFAARLGAARLGEARTGAAGRGETRHGTAGRGWVWHGWAGFGKAWFLVRERGFPIFERGVCYEH